ncbi:MAG: hypothetical protein JWL91_2156 [Sphingomonas bacterium]|jgi:hypothetical protein|nr:hypothetical protein [Sphingomonas bacterium]MDB5690280.1 hypothetical protein [Sphingomonas bacterium]
MPDYGLDIAIPSLMDPDPDLPWADDDDPLLVPGSMFLIDFDHSSAPVAGVPGNGALLPNIAWKRLKDLLGAGDASTLAMPFTDHHVEGTDAKYERSGKGGLHRLYSQVNNTTPARGSYFDLPAPLKAYLFANLNHSFYFSDWSRPTRMPATGGAILMSVLSNNYSSNNYLAKLEDSNPSPSSGAAFLGSDISPATNMVAPRFRAVGAAAWTGTLPADAAKPSGMIALAGNDGPWASQFANKAGSAVLYRVYLEDLTVSGRTFAKVRDIDKALYTAAMAAGGRFAGDTFTNPASFA